MLKKLLSVSFVVIILAFGCSCSSQELVVEEENPFLIPSSEETFKETSKEDSENLSTKSIEEIWKENFEEDIRCIHADIESENSNKQKLAFDLKHAFDDNVSRALEAKINPDVFFELAEKANNAFNSMENFIPYNDWVDLNFSSRFFLELPKDSDFMYTVDSFDHFEDETLFFCCEMIDVSLLKKDIVSLKNIRLISTFDEAELLLYQSFTKADPSEPGYLCFKNLDSSYYVYMIE